MGEGGREGGKARPRHEALTHSMHAETCRCDLCVRDPSPPTRYVGSKLAHERLPNACLRAAVGKPDW